MTEPSLDDVLVEVDIENITNMAHRIQEQLHNIAQQPSQGEQMTEQAYLDLAQQMKEIVDEKEKEMRKLRNELNDYKFVMYKVFGMTSFIEDILSSFEDLGVNGQTMEHNIEYVNSQIGMLLNIK